MASKTMSAPLAIIKKDGKPIGLMKDIRVTETFRRQKVTGLGRLIPRERPLTDWDGQFSCGFYTINLKETGIPDAVQRDVPGIQEWIDNVLLQEDGVDVTIFKKVKDVLDTETGLITPKLEEFATIRAAFVERDSFDISEGQVSGQNQDFVYNQPILYFM